MVKNALVTDMGTTASSDKKKKEKKGFKVDRYENYQRMRAKKLGAKDKPKSSTNASRAKSVVFDDEDRRAFLLGMHKRKNERRVRAFVDAKQKIKRDNAKTRRSQREEARQSYNRYAKVPILPNFTYQLPTEELEASDPNAAQGVGGSGGKREVKSVHVMPAAMCGGANDALEECVESKTSQRARLDADYVTVEVQPLFARSSAFMATAAVEGDTTGHGKKNSTSSAAVSRLAALPSSDFSDLPEVVVQELRRLKQETKGPARTKPRMRMMKELEKIRKIKKHSRKGHGKKTAKGKRKNR